MPDRGWSTGTARAAGGSRNFKLWIPTPPQSERAAPLVMVLHGCGHDAKDMAEISGMNPTRRPQRLPRRVSRTIEVCEFVEVLELV